QHLRALVNNAATWTGGKSVAELRSSELRSALDANLFSAFHATQAFLSISGPAPAERCIVNVGATSSLRGGANVFAFSAGKMALRAMSMSLARELWSRGVHVAHVVVDGLLDNERTRQLNPTWPVERFLSQEAVAHSILQCIEQDPSCW